MMAYGEWRDVSGQRLAICLRAPAIAGNRESLCDFEVAAEYLRSQRSVKPQDVPVLWMSAFRAFLE